MDEKQRHMEILGYAIIAAFISVIYLLIFAPIPESSENVLYALLGTLAGKFTDVYSFWFGSSKSGSEKTERLAKKPDEKPVA